MSLPMRSSTPGRRDQRPEGCCGAPFASAAGPTARPDGTMSPTRQIYPVQPTHTAVKLGSTEPNRAPTRRFSDRFITEHAEDLKSIARSYAGDAKEVMELLLRGYAQADDRSARLRAL